MNDKLRNLLSEGLVAKDMGMVESVKASLYGWVDMASIYQAMLLNTFITLLGLSVVILGSGLAYTVGGGIAAVIGAFGLFNNVRFLL